jgi:hypothetical protein
MGKWYRGIRSGILIMLAALLLLGLAACSGSRGTGDSVAPAAPAEKAASMADSQEALNQVGSDKLKVTVTSANASSAALDTTAANGTNAVGGGIGPIADANAGYGRKVIYQANLVMKVTEFTAAEEQLTNLIHLNGAFVLQFSDSRNADEIGATYVIKVPSEGFSPFLEKLQKIKSLKFEREVQGSDVTEEFVDLEARLKAKQTVETRLLAFMDKAKDSDALVKFSGELARVQEEIEQIKGRMRYLDQNVSFSTINLRLYQVSGVKPLVEEENKNKGFAERISDALSGSTTVLRQFGEGLLIVVATMLPVLIVLSIIGIPIYFLLRKRRAAHRESSEERRKAWNAPLVNLQNTTKEQNDVTPEPILDPDGHEPKDGGR